MFLREVHLYRAKFIRPAQLPLLEPDLPAREILLQAIREKPILEYKSGSGWRIGNVAFVAEDTGSFAVGKTTKRAAEKFDKESGDFFDALDDTGPYTKVFFDAGIGLLGIGKKSSLAADPLAISSRLKKLFEQAYVVKTTAVSVRLDYIPDPDDFLVKLNEAYAIRRFRASFTGPNPVDADEIFGKPLSVYCQHMDASNRSHPQPQK